MRYRCDNVGSHLWLCLHLQSQDPRAVITPRPRAPLGEGHVSEGHELLAPRPPYSAVSLRGLPPRARDGAITGSLVTQCRPRCAHSYLDSIEQAISEGDILLIENIGETVDPVLDPLLGRNTIKKGK